ncbi:MAG: hypothetical protein BWK79_04610 [Beggiatoa sp. IS2]|nr:MAG: hypothetical protein BWK79_04610 [Beggiatoa sp. IS2]
MQNFCYSRISRLALILTLVSGCATAPLQEMTDARLAVKAARDVRAAQYTPSALAAAEQSLVQAEHNLASGELEQARENALAAKEYAIKAHDMAVAIDHTRTIWQDVNSLLEKAEEAAQQGDSDNALQLAEEAYHQAILVLNRVYLKRAHDLLEKIKTQAAQLSPDEIKILEAAEIAYRNDDGKKANDLINTLLEKLPKN